MGDSALAVPRLESFVHVGISHELMLLIVPGREIPMLEVGASFVSPGGDDGRLDLLHIDCSASVLSSTAL